MPTKEDIEELLANCTCAWVENYKSTGVRGALLVSKINGNSIFLPSAGIGGNNATSAFGLWIWSTTKEIGQEGFTNSRGYQISPVSD